MPAEREAKKLLPCPFCGADAHIEDGRNDRPWLVECPNSDCHAQPFMDHADTRKQAIAAWNARTSLAAQDGLVDAGKGLLSALGFAEFDLLDSHNIPFPKPTVEVAAKKLKAALASIEVKSS